MASRRLCRLLVASRPLLNKSNIKSLSLHRQVIQHTHSLLPAASFHTSHPRRNIINIQDEEDFKERVVKSDTPVVVDFHAVWCGPCKILGPRLESLVGAECGKVTMAKVDIDEMQDLAISHGVEAVPTVLGMKDGKIVNRFVGVKDDVALESFIKELKG